MYDSNSFSTLSRLTKAPIIIIARAATIASAAIPYTIFSIILKNFTISLLSIITYIETICHIIPSC